MILNLSLLIKDDGGQSGRQCCSGFSATCSPTRQINTSGVLKQLFKDLIFTVIPFLY